MIFELKKKEKRSKQKKIFTKLLYCEQNQIIHNCIIYIHENKNI